MKNEKQSFRLLAELSVLFPDKIYIDISKNYKSFRLLAELSVLFLSDSDIDIELEKYLSFRLLAELSVLFHEFIKIKTEKDFKFPSPCGVICSLPNREL